MPQNASFLFGIKSYHRSLHPGTSSSTQAYTRYLTTSSPKKQKTEFYRISPKVLKAIDGSIRTISRTGTPESNLRLPHCWKQVVCTAPMTTSRNCNRFKLIPMLYGL
ncbi:hypothetical protein AVEN_18326-1 [Araneus ventricosus]|uniref:Uncharacterized protein n=1 Tax=Araneus ventricosus TaxID=182803 RepID=A0A4Y2EQ43_ARAVE|nr:hypothetical protein AVEN_18326-1 [Araneus ventricosus]